MDWKSLDVFCLNSHSTFGCTVNSCLLGFSYHYHLLTSQIFLGIPNVGPGHTLTQYFFWRWTFLSRSVISTASAIIGEAELSLRSVIGALAGTTPKVLVPVSLSTVQKDFYSLKRSSAIVQFKQCFWLGFPEIRWSRKKDFDFNKSNPFFWPDYSLLHMWLKKNSQT